MVYILGYEYNSITSNEERHKQSSYEISDMMIANYARELNISTFWGGGCTVLIIPKRVYYDQHKILHTCQKCTSPDLIV